MYHYFNTPFPRNAHTEKLLEPIRAAAKQYVGTPIAALPYSKFKLLQETGSRVEYEAVYIEHRRRMNVFTAMALAEEDSCWIAELEDVLWAICDEYSWSLPAHLPAECLPENAVSYLDLFSCETGCALSEILDLLGERLHGEVFRRVEWELRRRIMTPFLQRTHRNFGKNNWAAVCGGCAASVVLRLGTAEEATQAMEHADELMQNFLESYGDDGCCLEGSLYWAYGFGYFCYYAALVREYTHGEKNWFAGEKIRRIAEFRQKVYLQDNCVIPFADAPHNIDFHVGLAHFLAKEFDTVALPDERFEALFGDDIRYRFCDFIRDFYWYDPVLKARKAPAQAVYHLPDTQWHIYKENHLVFAAKGGHNGEPHNHNDIGNFLLFDNGKFILDDLGWPEYTKGYFGVRRLENICACSRGHSVPLIDGQVQKSGKEHAAQQLGYTESTFALDITGAYDLPGVTVQRRFTFRNAVLQVEDTFTGCKGKELRERFVTRIVPQLAEVSAAIENWRITCNQPCTTALSTQTFEPRLSICKMDMQPVETAQLIDFICVPDTDHWAVSFTVKRIETV